ncbi:MAG: c-type cytochrome, partial [Planctomycetia bacterium]|nr:c-type cytochrome [Planctomycetia bacterium]
MIRRTLNSGRGASAWLLLGMLAGCPRDSTGATEGETLFALKVRPLLAEKCLACHGADPGDIKGGLDLTSREAMRRGGDTSDEVLVPGDAARSLLYVMTTGQTPALRMPPKRNDRLSDEQTRWLRDWINAGAPWPDAKTVAAIVGADKAAGSEGVRVRTSGGLSGEWDERRYKPENLWA